MISTRESNGSARRVLPQPLIPVADTRAGACDPLDPLLDKLYRAAVEPDGWPEFLTDLAKVVHADAMTLLAVSADGGVLQEICFDVGTDPSATAEYRDYYATIDPWVAAGALDTPVGVVAPSESFVSESQLVRTEFYDDYYRPNGWHHGFGAKLLEDSNGIVATVTGHRHKLRGNFEGADLELMARLVPHLQRALRLRRDLDIMTVERDAGGQLLDRISIGAILVDERGRVIRTNRIADAILAANDGLSSRRDGLIASTSGQTAELRRAIAGATATSRGRGALPGAQAGGRISLKRPSGSRPYLVEVTPLDRQAEVWDPRRPWPRSS